MIKITDKVNCCGCSACANRCPQQCITMTSDEEGFLYPVVEEDGCIHCNLCDRVCPILKSPAPSFSVKVYAARHQDPIIREKSSSGGVFSALAESVIRENGVVFGAKFDKQWRVIHSYTESIEGLAAFRGSKYVQSDMGSCFSDAERFLKEGRKVLFSGTPCQIAGLRCYLNKEYKNLYMVDVICHGVPSPLVWREYVENFHSIDSISFRDKRAGWQKYGFAVKNGCKTHYEMQQQNLFIRGFLQNLFIRPCCFSCHFRNFKSVSDVTIADFWGVREFVREMDDDKGASLVILKNGKVMKLLKVGVMSVSIPPEEYDAVFNHNSSLFKDNQPHRNQNLFWEDFRKDPVRLTTFIKKYTTYSDSQAKRDRRDMCLLRLHLYKPLSYIKRKFGKGWR